MKILSPAFVKKWYGKLINIHPALLPSFKGENGQKDAFEYGVKISGCTTHFIDEYMDHGPIILQAAVNAAQGTDPFYFITDLLVIHLEGGPITGTYQDLITEFFKNGQRVLVEE